MSKTYADIMILKTDDSFYRNVLEFISKNSPVVNRSIECHGTILESMKCPEYIVIALKINKRKKSPYLTIHGIAGIFRTKNEYDCTIICSRGIGAKIIEAILNQAILQQVSAVNIDVYAEYAKYYRKFGFVNLKNNKLHKSYSLCTDKLFPFMYALLSAKDMIRPYCKKISENDTVSSMVWINPYVTTYNTWLDFSETERKANREAKEKKRKIKK